MLKNILLALCLMITPASATYTITNDGGGVIDDYQEKYTIIRHANERVVVDGPCLSACTLVFTLPKDQICITPHAVFGFHSASARGPFGPSTFSLDGTGQMWFQYPRPVRDWLKSQGWDGTVEHGNIIWMDNEDAAQFVKRCDG